MTVYIQDILCSDNKYTSDPILRGGGLAVTAADHILQIYELIRSKISFPTKLVMKEF